MQFFGVRKGSPTSSWLQNIRGGDVREPPAYIKASFAVEVHPAGLPLVMMRQSKERKKDMCVVHFHGGANVAGPQDPHWTFQHDFANMLDSRADACMVLYPRGPETSVLDALPNILECYRYLVDEYGADRLVLIGDSAGGGRILSLLMHICELGANAPAVPALAILLSPWLDLSCSSFDETRNRNDCIIDTETLSVCAEVAAGTTMTDWRVSPAFGNAKGLPPLIIAVGIEEVLLDQAKEFHAKAVAAGVCSELVLDHWFHAGELSLAFPESTRLAERLAKRIREEIPYKTAYQNTLNTGQIKTARTSQFVKEEK